MFPGTFYNVSPGILNVGVPIVVGIRAVAFFDVEEQNTDVVLRIVPRADFMELPSVALRSPYAGKRIYGNNITVFAEVVGGDKIAAEEMIDSVNFEIRPFPGGSWADIPAANPNHPNHDAAAPYFLSWDAAPMVFPPGPYWIRAVVTGHFGIDVGAIWTKVIVVGETDGTNREAADGPTETILQERIEVGRPNYQFIGSIDQDSVTRLTWPEGAVSSDTLVDFSQRDPDTLRILQETSQLSADLSFDIGLANGEMIISGTGVQVQSGWEDEDSDGLLDWSCVSESDLQLYRYDYQGGAGKGIAASGILDGTGDLYLVSSSLEESLNQFLADLTQVGNYAILAASGSKVYITSRLPAYSFSGKRLDAAGQVTIKDGTGVVQYTSNPSDTVSPSGLPQSATSNYLAPGLDRYSLVGKLGADGTATKVGTSQVTFDADGPAKLYLGFNDNLFSDNTNLSLMNAEVSLFPADTPTPTSTPMPTPTRTPTPSGTLTPTPKPPPTGVEGFEEYR
jgi:hypothetical protein